jgi:integrase
MRDHETIKATTGLVSHFRKVIAARSSKRQSCINYDNALSHLTLFCNFKEVPFNQLTKECFDQFQSYLSTANGLRSIKPLSHNSANSYFRIVLSVAKDAADERLINHNAINGFKTTSRLNLMASALSLDELQRLAKTPCRVPILKNAFLFSCLTGMQWKEISILKWHHVEMTDDTLQINLQAEGNQKLVPLNMQARQLLGKSGNRTDRIFKLHYSAALCINLNQWALKAGVLRNITFHLARQTFGKMLLDKEVPIELVSELLGHKHIKTTQKLFGLEVTPMETTKSYLRTFNI